MNAANESQGMDLAKAVRSLEVVSVFGIFHLYNFDLTNIGAHSFCLCLRSTQQGKLADVGSFRYDNFVVGKYRPPSRGY